MTSSLLTQNTNKNYIALELFLLSAVSLFLELLIIRWLSADIRAFTTFKFFPLSACFVGMGAGYALNKDRSFPYAIYSLFALVLLMKMVDGSNLGALVFPTLSVFSFWDLEHLSSSEQFSYLLYFMVLLPLVLAPAFCACLCVGSRLGLLFNRIKPLPAYCINIGGSIAGSLLFSFVSFLSVSPWQLIIAPLLLIWVFTLQSGSRRLALTIATMATIGLSLWNPGTIFNTIPFLKSRVEKYQRIDIGQEGTKTVWSPYQRLDLIPVKALDKEGKTQTFAYNLLANRVIYMTPANLNPEFLNSLALDDLTQLVVKDLYNTFLLPFQLKPAEETLIVGSGAGNDIAAGLRSGMKSIDAVELDPQIIAIGREYHPEKPYGKQSVTTICDDARHFFDHCSKKYGLIIFSKLDSYAVSGQSSSVRLDNFVYTKESLKKVLTLLKDDGLLIVSFNTDKLWFSERFFATMKQAAGYAPIIIYDKRNSAANQVSYFLLGKPVKDGSFSIPASLQPFLRVDKREFVADRILTDDWPYLYLAPAMIDLPYILVVMEFLLLGLFSTRKLLIEKQERSDWQMFFLGGAFMLLELQSIARLSLIFGSTWQTSAVVITAVLLVILAANLVLLKRRQFFAVNLIYLFLFVSLTLSYFCSAEDLKQIFHSGPDLIISSLVTVCLVSPIYFAALIFGMSFAKCKLPSRALAFNLLGAVLGALLEYISNFTGLRSLVLLAGLLYAFSYVFANKSVSNSDPANAEEQSA